MTTNQTIDGVPRRDLEAFAKIADHYSDAEDDSFEPWQDAVMHDELRLTLGQFRKLRALLDAPAVSAPLSIPDECPHMIVFDDTDREHMIFAGAGARDAALKTWDKISGSWNAHLFVRVERNSRDDRYPSAAFVPDAQPQGEPVAKVVLDSRNLATLELLVDFIPIGAYLYEQPAPVAVVMPERLQQVLKFLDGAENLDGHWFGEPHPSGRQYWWRNELRKALAETNLFAKQL